MADRALRSRRGKLCPSSGVLRDFQGRGGARPGAGRPSKARLQARERRAKRADSKKAARPGPVQNGSRGYPRLRPRGQLSEAEVQHCRDNLVYKQLLDVQKQLFQQVDANSVLQASLLSVQMQKKKLVCGLLNLLLPRTLP